MEVEKLGRDGYEGAPTLVAQTDVFIHTSGYVWNDKARKEGCVFLSTRADRRCFRSQAMPRGRCVQVTVRF